MRFHRLWATLKIGWQALGGILGPGMTMPSPKPDICFTSRGGSRGTCNSSRNIQDIPVCHCAVTILQRVVAVFFSFQARILLDGGGLCTFAFYVLHFAFLHFSFLHFAFCRCSLLLFSSADIVRWRWPHLTSELAHCNAWGAVSNSYCRWWGHFKMFFNLMLVEIVLS